MYSYSLISVSTNSSILVLIENAVKTYANQKGLLANCASEFERNFACALNLSGIDIQYIPVKTKCIEWNANQYQTCLNSGSSTGCKNYTVYSIKILELKAFEEVYCTVQNTVTSVIFFSLLKFIVVLLGSNNIGSGNRNRTVLCGSTDWSGR